MKKKVLFYHDNTPANLSIAIVQQKLTELKFETELNSFRIYLYLSDLARLDFHLFPKKILDEIGKRFLSWKEISVEWRAESRLYMIILRISKKITSKRKTKETSDQVIEL